MRNHGGIAGAVCHLDGIQRLGQSTDLVDLDQDGVGNALLDTGGQALHVGDEQVVANQLNAIADGLGQHGPAFPVVLAHTVFQRDDGIGVGKLLPHIDHLLLGHGLLGLGQVIAAGLLVVPLGGSGVDGDHEVLAGLVAGLLDGLNDDLQSILILLQVGSIAALVANTGGGSAVFLQNGLQGVEHLGAAAQSLTPGGSGNGHDHELLNVHVVGGMSAAVQDVHHRNGQGLGIGAADVSIQGQADGLGRGAGAGQRHAQNGVGAQTALVGSAVQIDHGLVQQSLIHGVQTGQSLGDLAVDSLNSLQNALAQITALVAVAQFASLINTGGSTGGHGGAAAVGVHAVFHIDFHFHGGIAAGVHNLTADDVDDLEKLFHKVSPPVMYRAGRGIV